MYKTHVLHANLGPKIRRILYIGAKFYHIFSRTEMDKIRTNRIYLFTRDDIYLMADRKIEQRIINLS